MNEYKRKTPTFSLCGLNCALCPRYHAEGSSKCPGCGGPDFTAKHPTCAIVTCNKKHDNAEFCYECSDYPCPRYIVPSTSDSFISYQNVVQDIDAAKQDLPGYLIVLEAKQTILEDLILNYNDGKSKGFYCLAVNLLPLAVLEKIINWVKESALSGKMQQRNLATCIKAEMEKRAQEMGVVLCLRK